MKNKLFIIVSLLAVLLIVGCVNAQPRTSRYTATQTTPPPAAPAEPDAVNSSTLKNIEFRTYSVMPFLTAELYVESSKVVGTAAGLATNLENLKKEAMANGLRAANRGQLDGNIADLMVEPTFFTEQKGRNMTVTAIGYPARYRNFKIIDKPDWVDTATPAPTQQTTTPTRAQTVTPTQTTPALPTTVTPIRLF